MTVAAASLHASTMGGLLPRAQAACESFNGDDVVLVSIRTRFRLEYMLAPDVDAGSGACLLVVQGAEARIASHCAQDSAPRIATTSHRWLFGEAEE